MNETKLLAAAETWISDFAKMVGSKDTQGLKGLLSDPSYFRDNGALTWDYRQFHGRTAVISTLVSVVDEIKPHDFKVSQSWPQPHMVGDGAAAVIEAFFDFKTKHGTAVMLVNAVPSEANASGIEARAIFTRLEALDSIEKIKRYPRGRGYVPSFPGQTWQQNRAAKRAYVDGEPDVIVIGAGQAGLTTSAYLKRFGVDVLNIDRYENVGDSWNRRYDSLYLHNPIEMNGFPFLSFPPHYPQYMAKDTLGDWLDLYARYMDLNVWTSTEFVSAKYNEASARWTTVLRGVDGTDRVMHPRHMVLATGGIGGKPFMPDLAGLKSFAGKVLHSSQCTSFTEQGINSAIVIGAATSAHDISRDLCENGIEVTMLQRGPVVINDVDTANLAYAAYLDPEIPTELVDIRYGIGLINPLREKASQDYHVMAKEMDKDLLTGLEDAGLKLGDGVRGQGWLDLFLRTGGGYYLNTGASELIVEGKIKVKQFADVLEFVPEGAKLKDGTVLKADLIVLATGYLSRRTELVDMFGDMVANRVGEVARLDDEGEWANVWGQTGQRGLWINGGGINQMRPGSARLALLIKADLDGVIPESYRRTPNNMDEKPAYEKNEMF